MGIKILHLRLLLLLQLLPILLLILSQESRAESSSTSPSPPPVESTSSSFEESSAAAGEPADLALLRKLWSTGRSTAKLNLTKEHQAILRIESQRPNTTLSISSISSTIITTTPEPTTITSPTSLKPILPAPQIQTRKSKNLRWRLRSQQVLQDSSAGGVYPDDNLNLAGNLTGGDEQYYEGDTGGDLSEETLLEIEELVRRRAKNHHNQQKNQKNSSEIGSEMDPPEMGLSLQGQNHGQGQGQLLVASSGSTETPPPFQSSAGLADVISRGRIDSVMYVYFGDKFNDFHREEIAGRIIQVIGGVVSGIAQVLAVLGAARSVKKSSRSVGPNPGGPNPPIQLHVGFALLISNLLLILAVHATEPVEVCASVALVLHFLHLTLGSWFFAHTLHTYLDLVRHARGPSQQPREQEQLQLQAEQLYRSSSSRLRGRRGENMEKNLKQHLYSLAPWLSPIPFIILSYLLNPDGYETSHFCWMSIEKGMVLSFILPVFILIGLNTVVVILSLRHFLALRKLWQMESQSRELEEDCCGAEGRILSAGLRGSAILLPLLAVTWFLEVVALENSTSIFFQVAAAFSNIAMSWLVLFFLGRRDDSTPGLFGENPQFFSVEGSGLEEPLIPNARCRFHEPSGPQPSGSKRPSNSNSSNSSSRNFGPRWDRPEIYELSQDQTISTIFK